MSMKLEWMREKCNEEKKFIKHQVRYHVLFMKKVILSKRIYKTWIKCSEKWSEYYYCQEPAGRPADRPPDHPTTSMFESLYLSFHWSDPNQTSNKDQCDPKIKFKAQIFYRKWNYPNRKWNYFSHFQASNKKTSGLIKLYVCQSFRPVRPPLCVCGSKKMVSLSVQCVPPL